jgi:MFS family permease
MVVNREVSPPPAASSKVLSVADFILRLAYFVFIPVVLFFLSLIFPLTGAFVNMAILVAYFLMNPVLRPLVAKRPWLGKLLKKFIRFEEYYREHPPKPFVYYVFFPLLFPYWLFVKRARREFLLFRGLSLVALIILVGLALLQYFTKWAPDIGFGVFLGSFIVIFVFQGIIVLTFLMPLATTVITYQAAGKTKRLIALFVVMALVTTAAVIGNAKRRHGTVPLVTAQRIMLRTKASPEQAIAALKAGMTAAITYATAHRDEVKSALVTDVQGGAEVLGPIADAAHDGLATYYKDDEADGFLLADILDKKLGHTFVLYAVDSSKNPLIWLAAAVIDKKLQIVGGDALQPETIEVMRRIAKK